MEQNEMTLKDYSIICQQLGFIEGVALGLDSNALCDGLFTAVDCIRKIIDKEMEDETK